jgi:hypothetical protein
MREKGSLLLAVFGWLLQSHNLSLSFCLHSYIVYSVDGRREKVLASAYPKSNAEWVPTQFLTISAVDSFNDMELSRIG